MNTKNQIDLQKAIRNGSKALHLFTETWTDQPPSIDQYMNALECMGVLNQSFMLLTELRNAPPNHQD